MRYHKLLVLVFFLAGIGFGVVGNDLYVAIESACDFG